MNWTDFMIAIRQGLIPSKKELVDGTTKVGDADKLDGHGAGYFVERTKETLTTSILEKALTLDNGMHNFVLAGYGNYLGDDLPHAVYAYGNATVEKRAGEATVILWGRLNSPIAVNYYVGEWSGWQILATLSDLAKYLPLDGGGTVKATNPAVIAIDNTGDNVKTLFGYKNKGTLQGYLGFRDVEKPFYQNTVGGEYDLLHTGNYSSYALPRGGGEINGNLYIRTTAQTGARLYGDDNNRSYYTYLGKDGTTFGRLGFIGANNAIIMTTDNNTYALHHDGNSAKVHIDTSAPSDTSSLWIDTSA